MSSRGSPLLVVFVRFPSVVFMFSGARAGVAGNRSGNLVMFKAEILNHEENR